MLPQPLVGLPNAKVLFGPRRSPVVRAPSPLIGLVASFDNGIRRGVAWPRRGADAVDKPVEAIKLADVRIAAAQAARVVFMTTSSDCCPPGLRLLNAPRHLLILNEA
jgi:hypothetical protein